MFDLIQIKLHKQRTMGYKYLNNTWIQEAQQVWYVCSRQTCLIRLAKRTKLRPSNTRTIEIFKVVLIESLMVFRFYQTRPNTIIQHQTRRPNGKWMVTKQCLMLFKRPNISSLARLLHQNERSKRYRFYTKYSFF